MMAISAAHYPVILTTGGEKRTARALAAKGYGSVESGAGGEIIFRLSQTGADMLDPNEFYDEGDML